VKDGHLLFRFDGGRIIRVEPHEQYEAWQVNGHFPPIERRFDLIARPGGGLAAFK
jgi:hypothetical protein